MKRRLLAGLITVLLAFDHAAAQQFVTHVTAVLPLTTSPGAPAQTLQVPAFDAALGTLTQVKLTYTSQVRQSVQGENRGGTSAAFNYSLKTTVTLERAMGGLAFDPVASRLAGSSRAAAFDGRLDFAGASGFTFNQAVTRTETRLETAFASLEDFTGEGWVDFLAGALLDATVTGPADVLSQTGSEAAVSLEVEYTFTPVPEPAAFALMLGLAGFGLVLLRRRAATVDAA